MDEKQIREKLIEINIECDFKDKSTEYMLQRMSDATGLEADEVVGVLETIHDDERQEFLVVNQFF